MVDMDGLRYSPDDSYYRLGPVHACLYVRVRETGDWDLFLGPLEWAMAETGGAIVNFTVFYPDDSSSGLHCLSLDNYNIDSDNDSPNHTWLLLESSAKP